MQPPPPPYTSRQPPSQPNAGRTGISSLPIPLVHRILQLTLDPRATPSRFYSDLEEERVRRIWALFRGLRGVNRVFWLVATSILRAVYLEPFLQSVKKGYSSDPFPYTSEHLEDGEDGREIGVQSVYQDRGRETAVFDRFIAVRVGGELRRVESSLTEEGEGEGDIFSRLQPCARVEDLLLSTLPSELITSQRSTRYTRGTLPLSHSDISITLTPGWVQLYLHPLGYDKKGSKELVLDVRRTKTLEGNVELLRDGLDGLRRGLVEWGSRVG